MRPAALPQVRFEPNLLNAAPSMNGRFCSLGLPRNTYLLR